MYVVVNVAIFWTLDSLSSSLTLRIVAVSLKLVHLKWFWNKQCSHVMLRDVTPLGSILFIVSFVLRWSALEHLVSEDIVHGLEFQVAFPHHWASVSKTRVEQFVCFP